MVRLVGQHRSWSGQIGTGKQKKQKRSGDLRANWFSGHQQARSHCDIISAVRSAIGSKDLSAAEHLTCGYRDANGATGLP
jgi:hypothetical protein